MRTDKYGTRLIEIQKDVEGETYGKNTDGTTWRKLLGYIEPKPPYKKGDILYVRETWTKLYYVDSDGYTHYDQGMYFYAADGVPDITLTDDDGFELDDQRIRWHPSIHMPKDAARIFLRVTDMRVERLQDITPEQAEREGVGDLFLEDIGYSGKDYGTPIDKNYGIAKEQFAWLWDSTQKESDLDRYGWAANPWVRVIEFERCEKPESEE